jgi:hypothetical protein
MLTVKYCTSEEIVAASARRRAISATTVGNIGLAPVFDVLAHGVGVEFKTKATRQRDLERRNTMVNVEKTWKRRKFSSLAERERERGIEMKLGGIQKVVQKKKKGGYLV